MSQFPVIPRALRKGDTIGFISPSERLNEAFPAPLDRARLLLKDLGYKVKVFWTKEGPIKPTISESIRNRIAELRAAFSDPDVTTIICTIGGDTATELLPTIQNDTSLAALIRANPKIFIGYSDITTLHWTLAAIANLRTFYGPGVFPELGAQPTSALTFTFENLLRAITIPEPLGALPQSVEYAPKLPGLYLGESDDPPQPLQPTPSRVWLRGGNGEGPLFGGCLPLVVRLSGVPWLTPTSWKGRIVFLETAMAENSGTRGWPLYQIQKALADLAARVVLEELAGLVFGRFVGWDSVEERGEVERVVRESLAVGEEEAWGKGNNFPILMHVDVGHTVPMLTLPMGAMARLNSDRDEFAILEAGVA